LRKLVSIVIKRLFLPLWIHAFSSLLRFSDIFRVYILFITSIYYVDSIARHKVQRNKMAMSLSDVRQLTTNAIYYVQIDAWYMALLVVSQSTATAYLWIRVTRIRVSRGLTVQTFLLVTTLSLQSIHYRCLICCCSTEHLTEKCINTADKLGNSWRNWTTAIAARGRQLKVTLAACVALFVGKAANGPPPAQTLPKYNIISTIFARLKSVQLALWVLRETKVLEIFIPRLVRCNYFWVEVWGFCHNHFPFCITSISDSCINSDIVMLPLLLRLETQWTRRKTSCQNHESRLSNIRLI
jgi:hypothetical protein